MFPPLEDSVLRNNPKFAALHANIVKNVLDPSGVSKDVLHDKEREAITQVYLILDLELVHNVLTWSIRS